MGYSAKLLKNYQRLGGSNKIMNKSRILLGLMLIVGAGGAVATGTSAFFSDTETSTGNTFTAGAIDLKVDHTLQTYNGNLVGGSLTIVSDTQTQVNAHNGVPLTFVHPGWTASIPGATWIWETDGPTDPTVTEGFTFTRTFNWSGSATAATLMVAADNYYTVSLNGNPVGDELVDENNFQAGTQDNFNVLGFLVPGVNTLTFVATNKGVPGSDGFGNPAGLLFKLTIDGADNTWTEKDLESGDVFWNFDDIKPGDSGTNVVSLHVYDNDAYACLMAENIQDNENTVVEPELPDGGPNGELSPFLKLFVWDDGAASDGVYNVGDPIIYGPNQPLSLFTTAEKLSLIATTTKYIGMAWCFGEQSLNGSTIECDGSGDGYNVSQTDSVVADLEFLAVQQRNNSEFQCTPDTPQCEFNPETDVLAAAAKFENPIVANPSLWDVFDSPVDGWNVEWRGDIPATSGSQNRPAIAKLELHRGVLGSAFEGQQYAELDTDWGGPNGSGDGEPASVSIYRNFVTVPGASYTVKYHFAPRPNTVAADNNLELKIEGVIADSTGPVAGGGGPIAWQERTEAFVAADASTEIRFTDMGTANSLGTFLDNVRLYQTSCPAN